MPVVMMRGWFIVLWLALALVGCDDDAGVDEPPVDPPPGCVDACPAGLMCQEGVCVGAEAPVWPVALRILPRADDPLAPAELRAFDAVGPLTRLPILPLSDLTPLVGRVRVADGGAGTPIRVQATARALFGIESQPLTTQGEVVDGLDGPEFVLRLAAFWPTDRGSRRTAAYTLNLRPEDEDLYPPWVVDDVRIDLGGDTLEIELPQADRLPTIEGEVLVSADNPTPLSGLRVFAVDEDGRQISTATETDAEGAFAVRFWPEATGRMVTLRVRQTEPDGPVPQVDRVVDVPDLDETPFARVYVGPLPSLVNLDGRIDDGVEPVGGVLLRMIGTVGEGTFVVDAGPTDADGRFSVALYPGTYRVDLEPPADAGLRLTRLAADLTPDSAPAWTVDPVSTVRGVLLDPAGAPVAHARVEARLIEAAYADPDLEVPGEAPPARVRQTEADEAGRFALPLDPGRHAVRVVPAAGSGLPVSEHPLTVPAVGALANVEIEVPAGAAVAFEMRDPRGEGAEDVVVEAWRTDVEPPIRVGSTTTSADGSGVIRLPVVP